jgi:murein L,D-transpeptidase YcbB/YkuD
MKAIMKKIFLPFFIAIVLISCSDARTGAQSQSDLEDDGSSPDSKNVSQRDYSITKANSYSTLFLDTAALNKYISEQKIVPGIARRMRSFYNTRNYQFAWFSGDGLTEQARGFWNLHDYVTTYDADSVLKDKALKKIMDNLITEESLAVSATNKNYLNTELKLTHHFIHYMTNNYEKGYVKRKEMERFIPFKKQDALQLADSLINKKHKDDKYFEDVNVAYRGLKDQLVKYYEVAKNGGWPTITYAKGMAKKGSSSPAVALLKKRLQISGDMPAGDTSQVYNDSLVNGVKNFQERHGFTPDGVVTETLVKQMNIPAHERVEQLLMNMDRMRWMAAEPKGNLIVVNIPEFTLHIYEGTNKVKDMAVVVGKEGHSTMMFNGDLNQVVFSPYWNVPPSIVRNEILPAMNRNGNYLSSQNMEIVSNDGELPTIRQRPGAKNALGRVKFLFPNSFNIYFHDTPSKSLFEKDKRAFSHGCIRLKEPEWMANYVLRDQPEWTPEKISAAMQSGDEKFVKVKNPIPVVITYYTAWVDETGKLNFREDIYGHDKKLAEKMFL